MLARKIIAVAIAASAVLSSTAFAEMDEVLERNKNLENMKDKEQRLKLQAEMSKHYKQMEDTGFFVSEDGLPLGVPSIDKLAQEFRKSGGNGGNKVSQPVDPFAALGPVIPREAVFGNTPLPTLSEMQGNTVQSSGHNSSSQNNGASQNDDDSGRITLVEVRSNSIIVDTVNGHTELRNGQSVGEYKLSRFEIDRAFLIDKDGRSKVISIDWTTSKRYADD
jgi:hypothetical protein